MINFKKILAVIVFGLCANVDADVYEVNLESSEIDSIKTSDDDKSILTRLCRQINLLHSMMNEIVTIA